MKQPYTIVKTKLGTKFRTFIYFHALMTEHDPMLRRSVPIGQYVENTNKKPWYTQN
jgi:hypothetical protein